MGTTFGASILAISCLVFFSDPCLFLFLVLTRCTARTGDLDSLAGLKISIMTRYEQYEQGQAYHSSLKAQAPASNPTQQPLVAPRNINFHGTNALTFFTPLRASRSAASIPPRSRIPSPNSFENDRPRHEHEEPRQSEEVYPTDGARVEQWQARVDDVRRRRKWEDNGWRQLAEQRRQEQDGILQRQIEAEIAAVAVQTAGLGQPTGQNQNHGVIITPASGTALSHWQDAS
ncbi:hypothetical protein BJV77DRAFT_193597 [Russula vinacea]|nr:hypothetical protein BJV77DRAFT_193597 [Russula vinacea]